MERGAAEVAPLTWIEYMMILKQRMANVFGSHSVWLSRWLVGKKRKGKRDGK